MGRFCILLLAGLLLLAGCSQKGETPVVTNSGGTAAVSVTHGELTERPAGDVIEISEKVFIAQTNDIYYNLEEYLGKTIKYEGIYQTSTWEGETPADETTYHYVIRYGPGCCGNDGNAGFEVAWDGDWPEDNDWVEAVGKLEIYEYNGWPFLQLRLDSLRVLSERGAEYVSQ